MSIYVAGSLAFDRIMSFNGAFADHILADKLHILNVSFLIDGLVEKRGGCAGNIAYTLALMGEKPLILATAGKNFSEYGAFLESKGISLEGVRVMKDEFTASCTLITDKNNNQINGFHPAAMGFPCEYAFPHPDASADWGIVSPGNLDDMKALPRLFREKGIRYIYDPGQQIPALSGDDLLDAITGSALLVTNDYELQGHAAHPRRTARPDRRRDHHARRTGLGHRQRRAGERGHRRAQNRGRPHRRGRFVPLRPAQGPPARP